MTSAFQIRNLSVSLRGRSLVSEVSLEIDPGEHVALLGASGSGKSLTAAAILGQLPDGMDVEGSMSVNGREIVLGRRRPRGSEEFAAVHQDPTTALNPMVRIDRQLAFPFLKSGLPRPQARVKAQELLVSVGISDPVRVLSGFSGELSGGQLQRVCIALALACRRAVLIADEPTTALDAISQGKVLDALRKDRGDSALLFITHDLEVAASLCTRAVVLHSGMIVEQASMEQLMAAPKHSYARELVDAARTNSQAIGQLVGA